MEDSMKKLLLITLCLLLLSVSGAFAQASLADGDQFDVLVKVEGHQENVTVIRDAVKPEQWYYVPNKPRLVEKKEGKNNVPVFALVKYQAKDPTNPENLLEGGVLQAAVSLALPDDVLPQLRKEIAKFAEIEEKKVLLSPLNMSNAQIAVYGPGGEIMGEAPIAPDIGPSFANQAIPLQINLTRLGADFSDALVKTGGGIFISYVFDYNGLTPKCGFKITVDWDQTYKHFSTNTKAKASYGGWFWGGSAQTDISTVRDELMTSKCINVESIAGEAFKPEDIDKYLMPVLEAVNKEIFNIEAPAKVEPAKAADPAVPSRRWGFSGGVSFSLKSVSDVKKGKTTYSMNRQFIVPRKTIAGGFVGIGGYPKEVQDKLIVQMPHGFWSSAWYSLPDVGSAESVGVTEVSITVKVLDEAGKAAAKVPQQNAKWTASTGAWKDAKGNERNSLVFALAELFSKTKDTSKLSYEQKIDVTQKTGNKTSKTTFISKLPIFDGEAAVSTPMSNIECVELNGSLLAWYGDEYAAPAPDAYVGKASDLTNVAVTLKTSKPSKSYTGTITSKNPEIYLLLNRGDSDEAPKTTGSLVFNSKKNKKTVTYKDFFEEAGDSIFLVDLDYLPEK